VSFSREQLDALVDLGLNGIRQLFQIQRQTLGQI
jgi:ribonuclease PH